jgi:hypothetical protein
VILLQLAYVLGTATYPNDNIGIHQLRRLGVPVVVGLFVAVWIIALGISAFTSRRPPEVQSPRRKRWTLPLALLAACACYWIFMSFSNHYINHDGVALFGKIPRDVADHGAHITHDEMLDLYVHSRLYYYANKSLGWSVGRCYQVTSALSGAVFVLTLILVAPVMAPRSRFAFVGLILCCGFVQLFFCDVECYTMVTAALLIYLVMAQQFLRNRVPLWAPAGALSLAMGFHLLSAWFLPSLVYLFLVARDRRRAGELVAGAVALALPMASLLAFFNFHGLPIQLLWKSSHAGGMGGDYARELAPLDLGYHWGMLNVLLLLWPTAIMLPALAYFKRLTVDSMSRFLLIASVSMIVFTFAWKAQLGIFEDWNLFAPGVAPGAILVSRSLCELDPSQGRALVIAALILTASLHTFAWVLSNHFMWP